MPELTKEEELTQAENAEKVGREYLERAAALRKKHGIEAGGGNRSGDLKEKVAQEETDAALFDSLPPGERTRLYLEDRETFNRLKEAKEAQSNTLLRRLKGSQR